ncbi:MAG: protoporphyrinogen/coproporphyrinogen oxidase [Actinomycetota bacterium]
MLDIIVLGAGPAGLGAAYRAAEGRNIVVLERANSVGGLAGSFDVGGHPVDFGSHRLHPATSPEIMGELRQLLGDDLQTRRRNGRIHLDGRWIGFPLNPVDLLLHLPLSFALSAARDAVVNRRRPADDASFAGVLLSGLGPTMCRRFYFPYARKLWGLEPEQIHAEQALRRVSGRSVKTLLGRIARRGSKGTFYYPRRGFGQLWDRLASGALERGVDIRCGCPVNAIESTPEGFLVSAGEDQLEGRLLWSTIPIARLPALVHPAAPPEVMEAAARLRSRAMMLVYLTLPVNRYTPFDAHYVPGSLTAITRISEPKNYRDGDDPTGTTVLCFEIPCSAGDGIWNSPQKDLQALVLDGLRGLGLPEARPISVAVRRLPAAYPVYDLDYERNLTILQTWADTIPGLLSFGRHGSFAHNNSHHALEMGWAAAQALSGSATVDRGIWQAARTRFALQVVED